MTNQHPITPPSELVNQWCDEDPGGFEMFDRLATKAARWGADQELEACCEWLDKSTVGMAELLHTARRPKPPTDKELALRELGDAYDKGKIDDTTYDAIRKALEQLND